eukprot:TRINITY_DN51726_c0_g1_i1.p1 TRINITY_DN51726_c0_g1~~TRINITY_DN51726_c0_g1_i1.p1  ORF type:complete len:145 (-),score=34.63 TRINITY_DN51726_c0_g1_i1:120-554(-)
MSFRVFLFFFFLMIRRPPRSTLSSSSAASDVYKRQVYDMDSVSAASIVSAFQIISMCGSPFAGVIVDRVGRLCCFVVAAASIVTISHVFWLVLPVASVPPIVMVLLMGVGYCCAVSYTHLRAHETPEHLVCRLLLEKKKKSRLK